MSDTRTDDRIRRLSKTIARRKRLNPQGLDPRKTAQRILDSLTRDDRERMFRCHVCRDIGFIDIPEGQSYTTEAGHTALARPNGPGAVRGCRGPRGSGCPYTLDRQRARKEREQEPAGEARYS